MTTTTTAAAAATPTKGDKVNADITALLKARHTLLWVTTNEEVRVERALTVAASNASYKVRFWDCASGITELTESGGEREVLRDGDPAACLDFIRDNTDRCVYVLRDLHQWMGPMERRKIRNLARKLQSATRAQARAVVILTPSAEVPMELTGHATVIQYPIPDRTEIAAILDDVISSLSDKAVRDGACLNGTRELAIDAAVGLTAEEAMNCYTRSLVSARRIDPALVSGEKKRIIARDGSLIWSEPDPRGLDGVGGLDLLKAWLKTRRKGFSAKARNFGLVAPKGMLLVGVPGGGKSLVSKCVSTVWGMPLLRLDLGAQKGKFVGESEAKIRKAVATAEAMAPCVLVIDEIDKALAGASGAQGDGGVSADALGVILSWMQDRTAPVFVIATANDVRNLPPELLRKGRFDEVFWVDLPTAAERVQIATAALAQRGRGDAAVDLDAVAEATEGFTGSEIDAIVPDALFAAFDDGERVITTDDLVTAARLVVPLSKTASEKIEALRSWAKGKARPASTPEVVTAAGGRKVDL